MSIQNNRASSRFQLKLMWSRMKKVSRLDRDGILELKTDTTATGQSIGLLILAGLAYGIGFAFLTGFRTGQLSPYGMIVGTLVSMVSVCFAAFVWSATLFLVGTKLFEGKTGFWELSRPLFFSAGPFLLFVLISIPIYPLQVAISLVAAGWLIVSMGVSVKQVMGLNNRRTLLTFLVGFLILYFIYVVFALV